MRPHEPLTGYYKTEADREGYVRRLFDASAPHYDRANAILSLGSGRWYRRRVLRALPLDGCRVVLDVAVGSGLVARELEALAPEALVIGLDPSFGMLRSARPALRGPLVQGRAEALPIATASVDLLTMGYALRHVAALEAAFAEYRRVLRPGGRVLILEIGRPEGARAERLARFWFRDAVPALARLVMPKEKAAPLMRYYWDTIVNCVPPAAILAALGAAGFRDASVSTTLGVFREYHASRG